MLGNVFGLLYKWPSAHLIGTATCEIVAQDDDLALWMSWGTQGCSYIDLDASNRHNFATRESPTVAPAIQRSTQPRYDGPRLSDGVMKVESFFTSLVTAKADDGKEFSKTNQLEQQRSDCIPMFAFLCILFSDTTPLSWGPSTCTGV